MDKTQAIDIKSNADKIETIIQQIDDLVIELEDSAIEKANGKANYSKAIGLTILKIKNGVITEWEGQKLGNLTAGDRKVIAEAICFREEFDKDSSENLYKALITKIEARRAQMNGYQSVNKVLQ